MSTLAPTLEDGLKLFGLPTFRPGQREVIEAVMSGRDCLCIMPTGGGKSLCYQLPAVLREGVTLVVSPLIALMKDQVDGLQSEGIRATFINSSLSVAEQRERLAGMATGKFDLVYVAPERLRNPRFLDAARGLRVQLLAVDEAHCISEWGHDFRPDYARLGRFRERLGNPPTIALTATATPDVREDIVHQLQLRSPDVFITGFARPNLRFEVLSPAGTSEKNEWLSDLLATKPGSGIIYCSTRKKCEEVVEYLREKTKVRIGLYHAGMLPEDRRQVQEHFMAGDVELIVATNAFGMGIDKADLRFVIHYNMPGTLEAYYQEAGRAGRDGRPSRCLLLYSYADRYIQEFFIENRYPARAVVRQVYEYLRSLDIDPIEITLQEIKERLNLSIGPEGVGACEQLLEQCGALERLASQQNMASVKIDSDLPTLVDLLPREAKVQRRVLQVVERELDERRCEWVYFHPHQLAAKADLDREALARALRELTKLTAFDYVPPFRGRAIHMLQRDCSFENLDIDFQELERRKQAELRKLDRVINYAQTRRCRQLEILAYFGDPSQQRCGACDRCRPEVASPSQPADQSSVVHGEGVKEAVRIALSGAARTKGRIGKLLLAKMLGGSKSKQIKRLRLHELSTYSLLDDLTQPEIAELLDALLEVALLDQSKELRRRKAKPGTFDPDLWVIGLTDLGRDVMHERCPLPSPLRISKELARKLNRRRRAPASAEKTPAVVNAQHVTTDAQVSSDLYEPEQALEPPVSSPPVPSQDAVAKPNAAESAVSPASDRHDKSVSHPGYYWTWRLLADGYTLAECGAIRRLQEEVVMDHLSRAADEGLPVIPAWFLSEAQLAVLSTLVKLEPSERLRAIVEQLPAGVRHEHVLLYFKCVTDRPPV